MRTNNKQKSKDLRISYGERESAKYSTSRNECKVLEKITKNINCMRFARLGSSAKADKNNHNCTMQM